MNIKLIALSVLIYAILKFTKGEEVEEEIYESKQKPIKIECGAPGSQKDQDGFVWSAPVGLDGKNPHPVECEQISLMDERTATFSNFKYDGLGPYAYFVAIPEDGIEPKKVLELKPNIIAEKALRLADRHDRCNRIHKNYKGEDIDTYEMVLPEGKTWKDFKYLMFYCIKYKTNLGVVKLPVDLSSLQPRESDGRTIPDCGTAQKYLDCIEHFSKCDVSTNGRDINDFYLETNHKAKSKMVTLLNQRTIKIDKLEYKGGAPETYFLVGNAFPEEFRVEMPLENTLKDTVRLGNEKGSCMPIEKYNEETIMLTLPINKTWRSFQFLMMVSLKNNTMHSMGYIEIPKDLSLPELPATKNGAKKYLSCGALVDYRVCEENPSHCIDDKNCPSCSCPVDLDDDPICGCRERQKKTYRTKCIYKCAWDCYGQDLRLVHCGKCKKATMEMTECMKYITDP